MKLLEYNSQAILSELSKFWNKFECFLVSPIQVNISHPFLHPVSFMSKSNIMFYQNIFNLDKNNNLDLFFLNYLSLKFQVIIFNSVESIQNVFLNSLNFISYPVKDNNIIFKNHQVYDSVFELNFDNFQVFCNFNNIADISYITRAEKNIKAISISYNMQKIFNLFLSLQENINIKDNRSNSFCVMEQKVALDNYDYITDNLNNKYFLKVLDEYISISQNYLENNILITGYIFILKAKYYFEMLSFRNYLNYNDKILYLKILKNLVHLYYLKSIEIKKN